MSEFLTPAALAAETGLSVATVRAQCVAGRLPGARQVGRRWLIHRPTFVASFDGPAPRAPRLAFPTHRRLGRSDLARIASSL